jgi:Uri superfamily endonuclease
LEVTASDPLLNQAGSYALWLVVSAPVDLPIGRLGAFHFPSGNYVYVGSAQGPGGLRARLRHHSRISTRPHWHLDWLRPQSVLAGIWVAVAKCEAGINLECAWGHSLSRLPDTLVPAAGFGSADCLQNCPAHLFRFPEEFSLNSIEACLADIVIQANIDHSSVPLYKITSLDLLS